MNLKYNCFDFLHFLCPFGRFFGILVPNFLGFAGFLYCVAFFLLFRSKSLHILVHLVIWLLFMCMCVGGGGGWCKIGEKGCGEQGSCVSPPEKNSVETKANTVMLYIISPIHFVFCFEKQVFLSVFLYFRIFDCTSSNILRGTRGQTVLYAPSPLSTFYTNNCRFFGRFGFQFGILLAFYTIFIGICLEFEAQKP